MTISKSIRLIRRRRHTDARGWLLKMLDGTEEHLPPQVGEAYVTMALPGQRRGGHYHHVTSEWFTVLLGCADVRLALPDGSERMTLRLSADDPHTLYVPPGIGHCFDNASAHEPLILAAYASQRYDPGDTVLLDCSPT